MIRKIISRLTNFYYFLGNNSLVSFKNLNNVHFNKKIYFYSLVWGGHFDTYFSYTLPSILHKSNYSELVNENKIDELLENLKSIDVVYPSIGENMCFLQKKIKEKKLNISFITREEDIFCWNFSNKGYFNFKSNIPKILAKFQLN